MKLIHADWPAPGNVTAFTTTRVGGSSNAPYDSMNLGMHVGDQSSLVLANRSKLQTVLPKDSKPQWLEQVHGVDVIEADAKDTYKADGCWSAAANQPCIVMTADCLPVCFTNSSGSQVAVAHAGWRGLCNGVLESTLSTFADPNDVVCWLGPAIGPDAFEVGDEVRAAFCERMVLAEQAFLPSINEGKWLADLYMLARLILSEAGVRSVHGGGLCTYHDPSRFFSYRREQQTGRMATVIWFE